MVQLIRESKESSGNHKADEAKIRGYWRMNGNKTAIKWWVSDD